MKVIILTTSAHGTAGHHLPILYNCRDIDIAMVIVSRGEIQSRPKWLVKRLIKISKIGIFGALNGIRMRRWYSRDKHKYCTIVDSEAFCRDHNIPFRRVPFTNSEETKQLFLQAGADVGLSLGSDYISSKIFQIPTHGMLNIHHELLPAYQNAQSIIWELYNGSDATGYTIHKMDRHIDTGDILLQETIPIVFRDTLADTVSYNYARLLNHSANGLVTVLKHFEKYYRGALPQQQGSYYTTPSIYQFLAICRQFKRLRKERKQKEAAR